MRMKRTMSVTTIDISGLPPAAEAEVVVVGGGPSGLCAAIAAAEEGADTLLIERYGFLGGMATAGLVNPFMTWLAGGQPVIEGIFARLRERLKEADAWSLDPEGARFDPETLKLVADEMVLDAGVRLRLHSMLAAVEAEGGHVHRLALVSKSGMEAARGRVFVDCTGDADLCAWAGAETEMGREEDGLCQPMTLNFRMGGVDRERMPSREQINALYDAAKERGEIDNPRENVLFFYTTRHGEIHFNTTRVVKLDATRAEELTCAELQARRQVREMVSFLRRQVPGFENAYLLRMGAQIGVRESRRVMGDYVLTTEDVLSARKFEDGIARGSYPVDIHNPAGTGTVIKRLPPGEAYDIPYRCLLPRGFTNLLVAGRPISCNHGAHSSLRVMPIAMAVGEAAGVAAALAAKADAEPRAVEPGLLRQSLLARGASLSNLPATA